MQLRHRRAGFTILEVSVTVAIIAVVAAMTVPVYIAWLESQNLGESVDMFRTNLVKTRTRAMEEGRSYRVAWDVGAGTYRIAPDELDDWPDLAGSPAGPLFSDAAGLQGLVVVDALKDGIQFAPSVPNTSGSGGQAQQSTATSDLGPIYILFRPNGTASILVGDGTERSQVDIAVANKRGDQRVIRVRAVTGGTTTFNPAAQ